MMTFVCTSDDRHCCHRKQAEETALPPVRSEPLLADRLSAAAGCVSALRFALRHIDHHEALMKARKALDVAEQAELGAGDVTAAATELLAAYDEYAAKPGVTCERCGRARDRLREAVTANNSITGGR